MLLQLSQFAFWEKHAPLFWKVLQANSLGFFEDDGEISLSRLSSLIASSPTTFKVDSASSAFRFQRIGKEAWVDLNLSPNLEKGMEFPDKEKKIGTNQAELVLRAKKFLKKLFFVDLPDKEFQSFPLLPPRQHHYPPTVKLAPPPPSEPLNRTKILDKLKLDLKNFETLLEKRKAQFLKNRNWEEDDDEELHTSSSCSDQEWEVSEILNKKVSEGVTYYEVKWKYFEETEWVREGLLDGCIDLVEEFNAQNSS
jgi:hypothetical protein